MIPAEDIIKERIAQLTRITGMALQGLKSYRDLPEKEKIPYRIMSAEILALEELLKGADLDEWMKSCVSKEHYCGAEGIKKAKEWIKSIHPNK
jgi:hypothetical protein